MNLVSFIYKKLPYTQEHINIGNSIGQRDYRMKHFGGVEYKTKDKSKKTKGNAKCKTPWKGKVINYLIKKPIILVFSFE